MEGGTFTPLVYTVGKECDKFYKHLCQKIANKSNEKYDDIINWVRCKVSFLCLKSCIMCIRGTRVKPNDALDINNANLN